MTVSSRLQRFRPKILKNVVFCLLRLWTAISYIFYIFTINHFLDTLKKTNLAALITERPWNFASLFHDYHKKLDAKTRRTNSGVKTCEPLRFPGRTSHRVDSGVCWLSFQGCEVTESRPPTGSPIGRSSMPFISSHLHPFHFSQEV